MDIYHANLELLFRKDDPLARKIEASHAVGEVTLGQRGHPTLRLPDGRGGTIALHSNYNPVGESERLLDGLEFKDGDLVLLLGFGLGYHIFELLKDFPETATLLVVEADPGVLRAALETLDLGPILGRKNVFLALGPDQEGMIDTLNGQVNLLSMGEVKIVEHPPSLRAHPHYYEGAKELIKDYINITLTNLVSLDEQAWMWNRNSLANLTEIAQSGGVKVLFDSFPSTPALIVSAGPSLDKNICHLKGYGDRAIIIAVDTAMKILQRRGLKPHLVVSVDGLQDNYRHFQGAETEDLCLVAEAMTHPDILKNFRGPRLIASIGGPVVEWVEELVGEKGELKAGGSVSTIAFQLARLMGCDPIVLIGQDLSFPGGKYYAQGTYRDDLWSESKSRFHTPEMSHRSLIKSNKGVMVQSITGEDVLTHSNIAGYLSWFKYEIGKTKATVINATEGGAAIHGAVDMTLKEVLGRYCSQDLDLVNRLDSLTTVGAKTPPWGKIVKDFENKIESFAAAEKDLDTGAKLLGELVGLIELKGDINPLFREFIDLDRRITSNQVLVRFLEPVLQKSLIRTGRRVQTSSDLNAEETILDFLSLYQEMLAAAIRMRLLFSEALERVKESGFEAGFRPVDGPDI